ncbi:MAG: EAL domain-containing protein [Proteobacteria bacterium]|nr:EAL domain-containing protein [Pseudomonadota bacterium]
MVFLVATLLVVELCSFALVNASGSRNATAKVEGELEVGQRVFERLMHENAQVLSQSARILTADVAFREAVASGDPAAIAAALANQEQQIGAGALLYVDLAGRVVAGTLEQGRVPREFEYRKLLERATITGAATSIEVVARHGWQLVAIPIRASPQSGWVVIGVAVDRGFARDLRQLTALDVSFFAEGLGAGGEGWTSVASTLDAGGDNELRRQLPLLSIPDGTHIVSIHDADTQARLISLTTTGGRRIVAVLHRPLSAALSASDRTRTDLILLAFLSLVVAVVGSVWITSNMTQPLNSLAHAAARMAAGDYSAEVDVQRADEIGSLANSLDHMREGIAEREKRLLTLAYQDQLTGLANRAQFSELLSAAIAAARPGTDTVAIFVMDLDRFKYVNDTLGHGVGDHVLRQVAGRLVNAVPASGCVARLGGDEFAVLLTGVAATTVVDCAKTLLAALEKPVLYEGQPLDVGTSVGIARFPQHGRDAQTLVRNADVAMYVAKRNKSGLAIYNAYYDSTQQEHLSLLGELRRAVEHNELQLVYQPKVSLVSSNVSAAEALIRWTHPHKGTILPAHFIPFAEHTGYIKVLTRWVLTEAIRQCGEWLGTGLQWQVCVNISGRDLMNRDLPQQIAALLAEHCVPAGLVCLEIAESGFMEDPAHARKILERLSGMGLRLAIDDYGVNHSSLSYLMNLPVQELKIDRFFVGGIVANPDLSNVVRSTIELGHHLGMKVVAEGVEDGDAWNLLEALGCDDAQGFFLSPPLEAAALVEWMRHHDGAHRRNTSVTSMRGRGA